jgi:hypothetical protein
MLRARFVFNFHTVAPADSARRNYPAQEAAPTANCIMK